MKSDLTFGYYDKEKFKGDMHWNDVLYKYMYGVKLDDIKFNGKSTGVCSKRNDGDEPCLITFDSGTSLIQAGELWRPGSWKYFVNSCNSLFD